MSGPNLSNKEINKNHFNINWKRIGKCNCHGACCRFIINNTYYKSDLTLEYHQQFGELICDKWWKDIYYVVIKINCSQLDLHGNCKLFNTNKFPEACRQFPITPFDCVYRYLIQVGQPCGIKFINKKTNKLWDMRRRSYKDHNGKIISYCREKK